MADPRLVTYLRQQLEQGYDLQSLRTVLLQNNYPEADIDEAIAAISSPVQPSSSLGPLIQRWFAQGYDSETIQRYLLEQGYSQEQVRNAFAQINNQSNSSQPIQHEHHIATRSILMLLGVFLIVLAAGSIAYYSFTAQKMSDELLDFRITVDNPSVEPGQILYFSTDFINFGEDRRYDISVIYTITDRERGTEIDSWKEVFAIDTTLLRNNKYTVPRDTPVGNYRLTAQVTYGKFTDDVFTNFKVYQATPEESCYDNLFNQDETGLDCGGVCAPCEEEQEPELSETPDSPTTPLSEQKTEDTQAVSSIYQQTEEDYSAIDLAKATASLDAQKAAAYCSEIDNPSMKDKCYTEVAKVSGSSLYCASVSSDPARDSCYIHFAFNNNEYEVCEKITNPFVKQSCDQLKKVNELEASS